MIGVLLFVEFGSRPYLIRSCSPTVSDDDSRHVVDHVRQYL